MSNLTKMNSNNSTKLTLSLLDREKLEDTFIKIKDIEQILTSESIDIISKKVKDIIENEKEESCQRKRIIRETLQDKLMEDATQAFYSFEKIKDLISVEDFTNMNKKASRFIHDEQMRYDRDFKYIELQSNSHIIKESKKNIQNIYTKHRDYMISFQEPNKKKVRISSSSGASSSSSSGASISSILGNNPSSSGGSISSIFRNNSSSSGGSISSIFRNNSSSSGSSSSSESKSSSSDGNISIQIDVSSVGTDSENSPLVSSVSSPVGQPRESTNVDSVSSVSSSSSNDVI